MKFLTKKIKLWLYTTAGFVVGLAIAFGVGTFYPNFITKNQIVEEVEALSIETFNEFGFQEPEIEYSNNREFVLAVGRCISWVNLKTEHSLRVNREIIIAMAVLESGYGKSRFANEGNNLFGIRTWDDKIPQLKPLGNPGVKWGVRAYKTKCQSVKHMINNLNTHHAYDLFRIERAKQLKSKQIDINKQIELLNKWSTNPDYVHLVKQKVLSIRKILQGL